MNLERIDAGMLAKMFLAGARNLESQKEYINELNVFPVPDGDTGTNMTMTILSAAGEVSALENPDMASLSKAISSGSLRGARGNSGVILSQLLRGFSRTIAEADTLDVEIVAESFEKAVETAYKAVMNPTEGTILTVARMSYEAGKAAAEVESDPIIVFNSVVSAANEALNRTPEMLPVLKKAGVVDAGGKGLTVIFEGMLSMLRDGVMIKAEAPAAMTSEKEDSAAEFFRNAAAEFDSVINFTYCTEFIIGKAEDLEKDSQELRTYLEGIGDCVVVADDDDIIKVHVHTENPGKALEEALTFGQLLTVKIENMKEQHRKAAEKYEKEKAKAEAEAKKREALKPTAPVDEAGFIAVAAGEGLENVFKELGCQHVVSGGQSMNPSTDDILEAVLGTPAKTVFVLPNNKNIILAAEQTVPMVKDRTVVIVPTRTIPQGMTALINFDPEISGESNSQLMMDAAHGVGTGLVTFAARNSEFGGKKIKEGDIIALENGKLTITDKKPVKALVEISNAVTVEVEEFVERG